jgi:hypothetical protein
MSASTYAVTPETYAAWRYLELTDELRPYDGERAEMTRGKEELDLLLAGVDDLFFAMISFSPLTSPELEKSPTIDSIERFFKRGLELQCSAQRSLGRSLERYHNQNICITDLEARPEAYPCFGTEEDVRRRANVMRQNHVNLAPVVAEIEDGQRSQTENENRLAALNTFIARRHALEQLDDSELSTSHG